MVQIFLQLHKIPRAFHAARFQTELVHRLDAVVGPVSLQIKK